jgi:chaperone required for assembly of F1-ATPase
MRRFYADVTLHQGDGGWRIALDTRPLRTPKRAALTLPTRALAEAVATEWRAQGDAIAPLTMPLTGLANAAIDIIAPDPVAFATPLAAYGESDLLCYRAPETDLAAVEAASWNPLLDWAERRYGVEFIITTGIVHVAQNPATLNELCDALTAQPPFALAALSPIITIGGSLVVALALVEGVDSAEALWDVVTLDERWQEERWGEDFEASAARARKHDEWLMAANFLTLVS